MSEWLDVLDNGSVSAFLGAFVAYLLVIATDKRRERRKLSRLRLLIVDNGAHARRKIETARTGIEMLGENKFVPAPVMKFPLDSIKQLRLDVIDMLTSDESRSVDALLYWMEAIDGVFEEIYVEAQALRRLADEGSSNEMRSKKGQTLMRLFVEAEKNLGHLIGMCDSFSQRKYNQILDMKHEIK